MTDGKETMAGLDPYEVETDADEGMESFWLYPVLVLVLAAWAIFPARQK